MRKQEYVCEVTFASGPGVREELSWLLNFEELESYFHREGYSGRVDDISLGSEELPEIKICWMGDPLWDWVDGMAETYSDGIWKLRQHPDGFYVWENGKLTRSELQKHTLEAVDVDEGVIDEFMKGL